jgi:hypothetical protein
MSNQIFTVAGITTHNNNSKVRFTDDMVRRIKQFTKGGAQRVDLVDLPEPMTKIQALQHLLTHPSFQSPGDQVTISDTLVEKEKGYKTGTVKVTVTKPNLEDIKARAKNLVNV